MAKRIYLDFNATTPVLPEVLQTLLQELNQIGNPSSIHEEGRKSRLRLDQAREIIARFLKVRPHEIIFTSGGTEGAVLLLKGILNLHEQGHIITSNVEHACVYETIRSLETNGLRASYLPVGLQGAVMEKDVRSALCSDTRLITLMAVNNETGVKTDIESIAQLAHENNIPFIVDGVALLGKELFHIPVGVTAMFFSGHKIGAPKGVGFCYIRQGTKLRPLFLGGGQESNRRAGTENLPGILALSKAVELLARNQDSITKGMKTLHENFENNLLKKLDRTIIHGQGPRTVNTTNVSFEGVNGEDLLIFLDQKGISVSHGSACSSGALEPSRVLMSMGVPFSTARGAIRISIGPSTTQEELNQTLEILIETIGRLRN